MAIFNKANWHVAFYAFQEDTWDGMDYELGTKKSPENYWKAVERGEKPEVKCTSTHPAFSINKKGFK